MFTGNEDHSISLDEAAELTKNYRNTITEGDTIAHFFGEKAILQILAQQTCIGIRIYYGLDDEGKKQLVITGVNQSENDLYNGVLAERSFKSPPLSGANNPLNS